jgi:TRAP-type C4-dicarboxylate transport system permease large subunit
VPVVVAAVAGSLFGALVLPRLPIAIASASGRLSVSRLAVAGAIPVAVVAVVALMLAQPRARAEPQQAAALVTHRVFPRPC